MMSVASVSSRKGIAVVTGGSRRIGAAIVRMLHAEGYHVVVSHTTNSVVEAEAVVTELNEVEKGSATSVLTPALNLDNHGKIGEQPCGGHLQDRCKEFFKDLLAKAPKELDLVVLVNNASTYTPTPIVKHAEDGVGESSAVDLDKDDISRVVGSNAMAPYYMTETFVHHVMDQQKAKLMKNQSSCSDAAADKRVFTGLIFNLCDCLSGRPLLGYSAYNLGKAAVAELTRSFAVELGGPIYIESGNSRRFINFRVNGAAPGYNVFPPVMSPEEVQVWRKDIPLLGREGTCEDIAGAIRYLLTATHVSGEIINVDGALRVGHPHFNR